MKKIFLFFVVALLVASCGRVREEVISTFPNGQPELVYIFKGKKDNALRIGEKMFYPNGNLRMEKHFSGALETPSGDWEYFYDNGNLFAKGNFDKDHTFGTEWEFHKADKNPYFGGKTDSVTVPEITSLKTPGTAYYYVGDTIHAFQFYEDFTLKGEGNIVDRLLTGHWNYYYPNGNPQLKAIYIQGKQNGEYISFRENGIPYFRGIYINGVRAGVWEFYDMEGNLCGSKDFDKK